MSKGDLVIVMVIGFVGGAIWEILRRLHIVD